MAVSDLSDLIDIGTNILATEIGSDGTVTCQTGDVVTQQVASDGNEWWQMVGFASRPSKPTPGSNGAEGVTINRDLRQQGIYGNLAEGETIVFAGGADGNGQARVSLKADGSITLYTTTDNTHAGDGVYLKIGPKGLSFVAPWGKFTFDATGWHQTTSSGARFDLGNVALPGPFSTLMPNYARITASTVTLDSPAVMLGASASNGGTGAYMSAAYSVVPPVAPGIPILGAGVGAVVVAAAGSTNVFVGV
jgi:hypothetical protein